jgi:hypothetical protein
MGGTKGSGAFPKGSSDYNELLKLFVQRKLDLTAEPLDVKDIFPQAFEKTPAQWRSGFNKCRETARETLVAMQMAKEGDEEEGIFLIFFFFLEIHDARLLSLCKILKFFFF